MSKNMNEKYVGQVQENLGKLVDSINCINNCLSSTANCDEVCKKYRGKQRTPKEQDLWDYCGCKE